MRQNVDPCLGQGQPFFLMGASDALVDCAAPAAGDAGGAPFSCQTIHALSCQQEVDGSSLSLIWRKNASLTA